jgi:hypothetical protein
MTPEDVRPQGFTILTWACLSHTHPTHLSTVVHRSMAKDALAALSPVTRAVATLALDGGAEGADAAEGGAADRNIMAFWVMRELLASRLSNIARASGGTKSKPHHTAHPSSWHTHTRTPAHTHTRTRRRREQAQQALRAPLTVLAKRRDADSCLVLGTTHRSCGREGHTRGPARQTWGSARVAHPRRQGTQWTAPTCAHTHMHKHQSESKHTHMHTCTSIRVSQSTHTHTCTSIRVSQSTHTHAQAPE